MNTLLSGRAIYLFVLQRSTAEMRNPTTSSLDGTDNYKMSESVMSVIVQKEATIYSLLYFCKLLYM